MSAEIKIQVKTKARTSREHFRSLLSSVRESALASLLRECALCDLVR